MTRKIVFALMIVSLLLLASCSSGGTNRGFGKGSSTNNDETFLLGTRGLDIKLADAGEVVIPAGESILFDVILENFGRESIQVDLKLTGYDPNYLKYSTPFQGVSVPLSLQGKSRYGPGEQSYITVRSDVTNLATGIPVPSGLAGPPSPNQIPRLKQPTTINACYKEKTRIQVPVCIDLDPLRDGPCPTENTVSLSEGQGGPIGISTLQYKSYRKDQSTVRLNLDMTFEQFDDSNNAKVFKDTEDPCNFASRPSPQFEDDVKLMYNYQNGALICPGLSDQSGSIGYFDLERRPTIRCYADIQAQGDSLNTLLDLTLDYTMWHSITQPIVIEQY